MKHIQNHKYPWEDSIKTEDLLRQLITNADETEKVDFKLEFNIQGSKQEKNELLRDMVSLANSYSSNNANHGFLILGVDPETKEIKGSNFSKESLSTHIDERMAKYVSPHINFSIELYDLEGSKKWGAIIIRPGIEMPHIFTNDSGEFNKGEIWVRKGSHKCPADSYDFSRFFAVRTESINRDLNQLEARLNLQEKDFKQRMEALEKKCTSDKPIGTAKSKTKEVAKEHSKQVVCEQKEEVKSEENQDLLSLVKSSLPKHSPLETSLIREVKSGVAFLESDEIPWSLHIREENKDDALEVVQNIQNKFEKYYKAIFELTFFGEKKEDKVIVLNSIKHLAKYLHKGGVQYDALYVRYLPLITTMYIISMSSAYRSKSDFLKGVMNIELFNPDRYDDRRYPVTDALFFIRNAHNLFDALHPEYPRTKWCDSVGTYLKQYFSSMLSNYEELQDPEAIFYQGEFLLSLIPVITESQSGLIRGHISAGSYFFYHESQYILKEFIGKNKKLLENLFGEQLRDVAKNFDEYAPKMANSGGCWGDGFCGAFEKILYPENISKNSSEGE